MKATSGALGMKSGDRIWYGMEGKKGIAIEFLQDGDAYIMWDDGTYGCVKWIHLQPTEPQARED